MAILEVKPLRMMPPKEMASSSSNVSDFYSSKVETSPGNSTNWLPPGWIVENKIVKSGRSEGTTYKVYKDPDTGMKFYSRREVLEHLKNPNSAKPSNKRTRDETTHGERPNWLPPDWIVEIKMKMSGRTAGSRYKVYVQQSTGRKFYSVREALEYLKTSNSGSSEVKNVQSAGSEDYPGWLPPGWSVETEIESGDRTAERKNKVKVRDTEREKTNVKGLPPGWFRAIRYRDTKAGVRQRVALFVDPRSGYAFFSTKDALRYIDSGHIMDCCVKPRLWDEISKNTPGNKFHSQPTGEERELNPEGRKVKVPLFTEENYGWKSEEEDIVEIDDSGEESEPKPKERKEKRPLFSEENCEKKSEEDVNETVSNFGDETDQVRDSEREETNVKGLPPGWFRAIRYRDTKEGFRKRVALFVDPRSEYAFFSTKDALRYIDNGHIMDCCVKPRLWDEISKNTPGNKYHSQPTGEEIEWKPEGRKVKIPLFTEENDGSQSEEDIIEIGDSGEEESEPKPKERKEERPFSEENCEKKSEEEVTETDDSPIEKAGTAVKEKEKVPEATPVKRTRFKVLASKKTRSLLFSKPTSAKPLTSNPSSVCPKQVDSHASKSEGNKAPVSSLLGEPSLDSCLEFAFEALTEDILILDKSKETQGNFNKSQ